MTGLEKIVSHIVEEANTSAKEQLAKASEEAAALKEQAAMEAQKECDQIAQKSVADIKNYKDRVTSSEDLKRRTAVLAAKQELIAGTIDKAYETFCNKTDEEYFTVIREMIEKFALGEGGMIYFSEEDHKRMPAGFAETIQAIAAKKNGTLKLSEETRNIKGGFILAYGGIEENCSFRALFDVKRDELQDKVQKELFS